MKDNPKECPDYYCGCTEDEHEYEHADNGIRYACSCGVSGPWCESLQAAHDAWNELPRWAPCGRCACEARKARIERMADILEDQGVDGLAGELRAVVAPGAPTEGDDG